MKIITKEFMKIAGNAVKDVNEKVDYLEGCLSTINKVNEVIIKIDDYIESTNKDFDSSILLVMDTEALLSYGFDIVQTIYDKFLPSTPALVRRVNSFILSIEDAKKIIKNQTELYIPYDDDDLNDLKSYLTDAVGNLACYTYFEFGFDSIYHLGSNPIEEIYDCLDTFARKSSLDEQGIKKIAVLLNKLIDIYKPCIGVFERYPELLEPFSKLVGEDLYDCVDIDLQVIESVINGKLSVDDFKVQLESLLEKEDNE